MAVVSATRVTVTTTATLLIAADSDGCRILVHNPNGTSIQLGGSDVTATTGLTLDAAAGPTEITIPPFGELYGITASGTAVTQVLAMGNR